MPTTTRTRKPAKSSRLSAEQTARLNNLVAILGNLGSAYWDANGTYITEATLKH